MVKKILSLFITLSLLLAIFSASFAATPEAADHRANYLLEAGIFSGYDDGTLGLEKSITRAEFSKMLANIIVEDENDLERSMNRSHFSDIKKDNWAAPYVNILFDRGIVNGYSDGGFKPNNQISFNEIIVMIVRSLDVDVEVGSTWSEGYINKAKQLDLLENVIVEDYNKSANRQDVVDLIYNTLKLNN